MRRWGGTRRRPRRRLRCRLGRHAWYVAFIDYGHRRNTHRCSRRGCPGRRVVPWSYPITSSRTGVMPR